MGAGWQGVVVSRGNGLGGGSAQTSVGHEPARAEPRPLLEHARVAKIFEYA